jgi:hypothetical protein
LQEDQDWGIVAMVLDRLFLWMFGAAAVVGKILVISYFDFEMQDKIYFQC